MARAREIEARTVRGMAREIGVPRERLARAGAAGVEVARPDDAVTLRVRDEVARLARRWIEAGSPMGLEPHLVDAARWLERTWEACMWDDGGAIDPARIRVDGGGMATLPDMALTARERIRRAMRAIGPLARDVVIAVVIDGMTLDDAGRLRALARNRRDRRAAAGWVLKVGLDALAAHLGYHGRTHLPEPVGGWA